MIVLLTNSYNGEELYQRITDDMIWHDPAWVHAYAHEDMFVQLIIYKPKQ